MVSSKSQWYPTASRYSAGGSLLTITENNVNFQKTDTECDIVIREDVFLIHPIDMLQTSHPGGRDFQGGIVMRGTVFRRVGLLMFGLGLLPAVSLGQVTNVISQVDATAGVGAAFKVYLATTTGACAGSTYNWAYLNSTDTNYSAIVATLLAAKEQGSTETVYATTDSGTNYCHLSTVQVQ
jgi:hypothetical protein